MFNKNKEQPKNILPTVIEVTCLECHETYNLRSDVVRKIHNCRCSKGGFEIRLAPGRGEPTVFFIDRIGNSSPYKEFTLISQGGEKA